MLNPICHLLALWGSQHILHLSRIRVKLYPYLRTNLLYVCWDCALLVCYRQHIKLDYVTRWLTVTEHATTILTMWNSRSGRYFMCSISAIGICHTVTAICRYRGRVGTNRFECAVGGVRHPQHTQTCSNSSTTAADSSNGVTNTRCCRYSCMCSWWWVEVPPETCRAVSRYKWTV
jgi:hypothetical protein